MLRMYDFECRKCGRTIEKIIDTEDPAPTCRNCGHAMAKLLHAPHCTMGAAGAWGYYDDNLQCYIHTNRQRKEEMRKQGVSERGATPKPYGDAWV